MKILFYPDPLETSPISRVFRVLSSQKDITWHNNPNLPFDIHFFWSYTKSIIKPKDYNLSPNVINAGCFDITKKKVHKIFNDISINPATHNGICVEKIDLQGRHRFHKLIQCPTKPKPGYVYEKYFKNFENGYHIKHRVYYANGITHVIRKYTTQKMSKELPIFHMASMPPRIQALDESIPSILHQCKHLYIYLNNYRSYVPRILLNKKITLFFSEKEIGDTGDVGKFYNCDNWEPGFHCTVDDKIIYPKNYSQYMMRKVEQYHRKAVVSLHGRNFHPNRKSSSYYRDTYQIFQCTSKVIEQFAHNLGTGVTCFHTETVKPSWEWFPFMNMTDIYMSIELQKRGIPILIAEHEKDWIKVSQRRIMAYGICNMLKNNDFHQTEVVNSFDWIIHKINL